MKISIILCFLLITTQLYAGTSVDEKPVDPLFSTVSTATKTKINQTTLYMGAYYLQESGQYGKALRMYSDLFSLNAPEYVYEGYLRLLSQTNQFSKIVSLIDKTQEQFEDDIEIQLIYAQSLLNTNHNKQAAKLLEKLKKKYPNNEQIIYYSTAMHEKTNNLTKALADIDAFLAENPPKTKYSFFHFLKAKIYLKKGDLPQALASINQSLKLFPRFDKGILFKALLLEQMQKIDAAIETYKDFLNISGNNPLITKQLVHLLFSKEKFAEAAQQLKRVNSNQPEYFFDLALLEWKAKNYDAALQNSKKAISKNPTFTKAKILIIQIFLEQKKYDDILNHAKQWLLTSQSNHIIHMLLLLPEKGVSPEKILSLLAETNKKNNPKILLAMGDLSLKSKQHKKAVELYTKVFRATKNEDLKAKIRYQNAFIYFKANKRKQAKKILDEALKQKIVYPPAYNLMAFMLVESNKDFDQALVHINKALEFDPTSPDFLDTKGLILQKQQKYTLAIKKFEEALKYAPQDKQIKSHLYNAKNKIS